MEPEHDPAAVPTGRPTRPRHRAFSPGRIWTIGGSTFTQLVRMKVFYFLLIFSAAVIAAALFFLSWSFEQELKLLKDVSLGAMAVFAGLFAIVAAAVLIPRDIEDRTLYTILAKPVPRFEYLLGKLLGVLLLIAVSLALMQVLFSVVLWVRQQAVLEAQLTRLELAPPLGFDQADVEEAKAQARAVIARQGVSWNLLNGAVSIFLKAAVMASVSLLLSTFASSTLFTVIAGVAVFIIGHLQGLARDHFLGGGAEGAWERLAAVAVAIVFPDFRVFDIVDDVAAGSTIPAGLMLRMAGLAFLYVVIYNLAAFFVFADREL